MAATVAKDFQFARLLIDRGAKVAGHDRVHKTPLLWTAYHGHVDLLKLLLARGANLHEQDDLGQNALTLARKGNHPEAVAYLQSVGLK